MTIYSSRKAGLIALRSALALVICAGALSACSSASDDPESGAQTDPAVRAVRVTSVQRNNAARVFALTGVTRSSNRAQLSFQVSGRLAERPVNIGSDVDKGDLIARLTQPGLKPAADAAAADVRRVATQQAQAKRDLARVRQLVDQNAATRQELENARARSHTLTAQLAQARAQSTQASDRAQEMRLNAPLAGTVEQVNFQPGEFVPAGQPVVSLSGEHALEAEIGIPERLLATVNTGDTVTLTLPFFDNRKVSGTVTQLARAARGRGDLFAVIITLDESADLRAGLSVNWQLESPPSQRLMVPTGAVVSPGGSDAPRVYRVEDNIARAVPVTLGEIVGENVLVSGDLNAGDAVVSVGLSNISDGRRVRVLDR